MSTERRIGVTVGGVIALLKELGAVEHNALCAYCRWNMPHDADVCAESARFHCESRWRLVKEFGARY